MYGTVEEHHYGRETRGRPIYYTFDHKYSLVRPVFVLTWEAQRLTTGSMDGSENRQTNVAKRVANGLDLRLVAGYRFKAFPAHTVMRYNSGD